MKFVGLTLLAFSTLQAVAAHSFLVQPLARYNLTLPDVENRFGCPLPNAQYASTKPNERSVSYKAGEKIDVRYWRNNHIGGFIRWSIVPTGKDQETKENFDKNAFFYTCRESGASCLPKGTNTPFAGDNAAEFSVSCGDTITLPDWLPAGDYTLQWMWFSVGSSSGNLGWAEMQFKSCANIKLTTSGTKSKAPTCPTFVGGDRVTKLQNKGSNQCFYFQSTAIETKEQYKGDNNNAQALYKFGIPADVEKCSGGSGGVSDDSDKTSGSTNSNSGSSTTPSSPASAPTPTTKAPSPRPASAPAPTTTTPTPNKKCVRRRRS